MAEVTKKSNVIIPEVMGAMIDAKIDALCKLTPYAKVDTSLVGVPGDTKTVPSWNYIGDAEDFDPENADGKEIETAKLTCGRATFTIKCAAKSVGILQTAINSGLGNPVGQAEMQLAKSIVGKVDNDVIDAAYTAVNTHDAQGVIGYAGIVDAVTKFEGGVAVRGSIGKIAGCWVKKSKKVKLVDGVYQCPIIKMEPDSPETEYTEDELPALTIFLKKDTQVDHEWFPKKQRHDVTAAKYYGVALTNAAKVVIALFAAAQVDNTADDTGDTGNTGDTGADNGDEAQG